MITGAAKVAGVVGWPVAHSLSPLIHNAWIDALGLDAAYVPFPVQPERFASFVQLAGSFLTGINVTLPHKPDVLHLASAWSQLAWDARAANVLTFGADGASYADNTDGAGLVGALSSAGWKAEGGACLVLGAGGAARGAIPALIEAGCRTVRIAARKQGRAVALARELQPDVFEATLEGFEFEELSRASADVTVVINATSAGLKGEGLPPMDAAPPDAMFMDMVYTPLRTPFLRAAAARGHTTVDGLAMLIGQARPSFEAFFGVPPPPPEVVDVRALCLEALGEA